MNPLRWFNFQTRWIQWLMICTPIVAVAASLQVDLPEAVVIPGVNWRLPEICWSRREMDLPCPGCGLTRCFIMAAHGDLVGAARMHPGGILLFAFLAAQLPLRLLEGWLVNNHRRAAAERVAKVAVLGGFPWLLYAIIGTVTISLAQWVWHLVV